MSKCCIEYAFQQQSAFISWTRYLYDQCWWVTYDMDHILKSWDKVVSVKYGNRILLTLSEVCRGCWARITIVDCLKTLVNDWWWIMLDLCLKWVFCVVQSHYVPLNVEVELWLCVIIFIPLINLSHHISVYALLFVV